MYTPKHLNRWKHPSNYIGASWPEYYVFLSRHRDSDALQRANFDAGLAAIGGDGKFLPDDETPAVNVVTENHWAVGWVQWIAIHEAEETALRIADDIAAKLEDYPVVNEELWSEYETAEANEVWANCYNIRERIAYIREHRSQFEFQSLADMLGCVRGQYFAGYASEILS